MLFRSSPPALALSSPASPSLTKTNPESSNRDEQQRGSYWITTFGCQMNKADSERMAGILETMGYQEAKAELDADLVLYNTCTIRDNAEQKVYSYLGRQAIRKRTNPNLTLVVAGCRSTGGRVPTAPRARAGFGDGTPARQSP